MTPTQAQIDAARGRLQDYHALYGTIPDEAIAAALIAAAEVGDLAERLAYSKGFNEGWERGRRPTDSGLDAALVSLDRDKAIAATIERCAQMAENYAKEERFSSIVGSNIAAAIRALATEKL